MRLSFDLMQKLSQKQILAPRMIQSMEILQLPLQELQERIDQELEENPVLELREQDPDLPDEGVERENPDALADTEKELVVQDNKDTADFERLLNMNEEWPDHFEERSRPSQSRIDEAGDRQHDAMANVADRAPTLQDHLDLQLADLDLDPKVRELAERVISSLDQNGYLPMAVEDLLPPSAPAETIALARQALTVVQGLDPAGVGAQSLRECLLLQLHEDMDCYEEIKTLVSNHLDDMKDNRLPAIQKRTGLSIDEIKHAWEELRKLNPKPGANFSSEPLPTVTPEVFVERGEDGVYRVRLQETGLPSLRISEYYRQRLMSGEATEAEKEFIRRKVNSAQWLIESIEQRRSTLTKVSQAIVDHQLKFLDEGPEHVEPLKMQQIADKVGVHVTTVSRAVDDKYIQTPRGIFALKRFFVGGTVSDQGEEVAWDSIRLKLQEVIDKEDKSNPLSDDDLVIELKKHGLTVARRTITKYRQKMDIPSSRQRRDWALMQGEHPPAAVHPPAAEHDPGAGHPPATTPIVDGNGRPLGGDPSA